jgi:hypothetical protein
MEQRKYETGAVRDSREGKGRFDLMPLDVAADVMDCKNEEKQVTELLRDIDIFKITSESYYLENALRSAADLMYGGSREAMLLDVGKLFESGAEKYGERNWEKGIPISSYIDSGVRHLLKYLNGETDEAHDRAFVWNLMCAIWTKTHKPEMDDYTDGP